MNATCLFLESANQTQQEFAKSLGYFVLLEHSCDIEYISEKTPKAILKAVDRARAAKRQIIVEVLDEKQLRFVLEKTKANAVMGLEWIHPSDSVHYARTGFDQIIAQLALRKQITIVIDLTRVIRCNSFRKQGQLLGRIRLLCSLARKKGVPIFFCTPVSNITDLRAVSDLKALALTLSETRASVLEF